ncbi:MAG TPA: ATP phosphoribosyltransferase regulatory subunit, partial [Nitrospiria bacterium]|nr:ATP phosphoribosyltransferase regulatory subunit [Nitrospiria bacterium]
MTRLKDKSRPMLPKGMATFLPEAAYEKRRIEETVMDVYASWGYREVIPPIFEYLDVIGLGMGEELIQKGYKFVDRSNGRLMLLRPDITPQIARIAAMLMSDIPKPLRVCYRANVFRHEDEHAGRSRELFQMGGELIGSEGPEGDAEMAAIAIRSVEALGIKDFKVSLGQVGFFNGLVEAMDFPPGLKKQIQGAVIRRDRTRLAEILKEWAVPVQKAGRFSKILSLIGQDEVMEKALLLAETAQCRAAIRRLKEVYRILKGEGWGKRLVVDLAEVQGADYYTGVMFEVFSEQVGVPLGRGGRYDTLVGKFGTSCPATGFAFNMESLQ